MAAKNCTQLNQVRSEVCRRRKELDFLAQQPSANGSKARNPSSEKAIARLDLQPTAAVPIRIRLRDLLKYDDRRFVEYAYRCILNRPMDSGGEWYLERLRKGKSKTNVLLQIRYGREGRKQGVRIRGIRTSRALSRLARLPVLGLLFRGIAYVLHSAWCLARLPLENRRQEGWKQYAMSLFTKVEDHVNSGQTRIERLSEQFHSECRSTESEIRDLLDREKAIRCQLNELESIALEFTATHKELKQVAERVRQLESARNELESITLESTSRHKELEQVAERVRQLESAGAESQEARRKEHDLNTMRSELEVFSQRLSQIENGKAELELHSERSAQIGPLKVELDVLSRRLDRIAPFPAGQDELYASLEDRFRGSTDEIRERQEYYVPFVQAAEAGTPEAPVADLGCGRGEWLSALRNHGKIAYGIDLNEVFIDRCQREGLTIKRDDALHHLESIVPASLGAVTGFHIIEHLPGDQQIRLVQLAFRALRPGGIMILETPNPEHLSVTALRFYLDPTHLRQVPIALLQFLAEHTGFQDVRIERRSPSGDGEASQGWSQYQDYAVIAVRPRDA